MRGDDPSTGTPALSPVRLDGQLDPDLSRWRWLVKWFLAIPHLFVLFFLWIGMAFATVAAGVAILFTGVYPRRVFDFDVGVLRWTWRVRYYAFDVLGTDRYPPFSLAPHPDYPAQLSVEYPERLSRGLVIVKSWLLALPHLVIVAILLGSVFWFGGQQQWAIIGTGLLGLLTLVAMVVLLFTGRYLPALYDFIMGLNRWVYRVLAYVLLMTDEYPPFRLDGGGLDPGTDPDSWHPTLAPGRRWTRAREQHSAVVWTIAGTVSMAAAFALWWLVEETNPSGNHDADLLPLFALIPLAVGFFKLFHARVMHHHGT
jgi:hypothetical protein